ncbi:MAG: hypothetical protein KKA42_16330, partial [candidate division Zixibacteria bacterium]|nr:hypothetical protein [candidate division Zixibacteria bacterium]
MNRKAVLLGIFATGGQVLLLRELVAVLHGDQLFIGVALFAWLMWVAVGAALGGRSGIRVRSAAWFVIGGVFLPVSLVGLRLSSLLLTDIPGEAIPFTTGTLATVILLAPLAVVSGALFPAIVRDSGGDNDGIVRTYLFEGLGAFAGGAAVSMLVGVHLSALGMTLLLMALVFAVVLAGARRRPEYVLGAVSLLIIGGMASVFVGPTLDQRLEEIRYDPYAVVSVFDTPYSRQTILSRDGATILMTDNAVEGELPNREAAEYALIP